jgi:protease-4
VLTQLLREDIAERRAQRRWRWWRLLWWTLVLSLVIYGVWRQWQHSPPSLGRHTAMVVVDGAIAGGGEASAEAINQALRDAFDAPEAAAVVLLINSPGGSPVQAGIVNDEIWRLKTATQKPVYAVIEDMGTSAAYYIAAAADEIYVDKASIVGSIGVLMDGFGFTELMRTLGVERRLLTAGKNKGFMDPFSPQNATQQAHAKAMLAEIHQQFIETVRKGRGERLRETPEVFSGLFWTGQRAVDMGLADGLGSLDSVARDVVQAEDVVDYSVREDLPERLVRQLGASAATAAARVASSWSLR